MVKKNKKNAKRLNQNRDRFSLFLYTAKFTKAGVTKDSTEDTKEKTRKEGTFMEGKRITQKSLKVKCYNKVVTKVANKIY